MTPEKIKMFYLGYDLEIFEESIVFDSELVLDMNQNQSEVKQLLPWKKGDKFELLVRDGKTIFSKIKE